MHNSQAASGRHVDNLAPMTAKVIQQEGKLKCFSQTFNIITSCDAWFYYVQYLRKGALLQSTADGPPSVMMQIIKVGATVGNENLRVPPIKFIYFVYKLA